MRLTWKQRAFCREYVVDLNATRAAIRAGYSERSAQQIGSQNLQKPLVKERIEMLTLRSCIRAEIDLEDCLEHLREMAMNKDEITHWRLWAFELLERYLAVFDRICDSELPTHIIEAIAYGKRLEE